MVEDGQAPEKMNELKDTLTINLIIANRVHSSVTSSDGMYRGQLCLQIYQVGKHTGDLHCQRRYNVCLGSDSL